MTFYSYILILLGIIVGFYWARVLKLVRKTRLKTGRSAQLLPKETLGKVLRIVWYPTVALWCLHPWITLAASHYSLGAFARVVLPLLNSQWLYLPGAVLAIAAMWGTLICWRRMGTSWRMGINPGEKTELVVAGPYAYVAHPIYGLQQLLVIASLAILPSPLMLAVTAIEIIFLNWEASREERYLCQVHGEIYAGYRRRVGRFLPKLIGRG